MLWYADDDSDAPLAVFQRRVTHRVVQNELNVNQLDALVLGHLKSHRLGTARKSAKELL